MIEVRDEELLAQIEENHEDAFLELIERHKSIIKLMVSKYKTKALSIGLEISDVYQEGLIGLINAIKTFDKEKEASFKTYVTLVIERQILDLIRNNDRIKHKTLNEAISLDIFTEKYEENLYNVVNISNKTPETDIIDKEETEELKKILTNFELKVYELKVDGKTNKEIALILDKDKRSIENTTQRIKQKIKEYINE